ncbi:MAG: hypothetical protein ACLPTF_20520 [Steroidobacteraceae bacterium]
MLPDTVAFNVDVAATVVFHVDELLVEFDVSVEVVMLWLSIQAVELSFAWGLLLPPWVVVAVAVCVVSLAFVLLFVGLANADPDASIKAIAVANVRLLIEISPVV